MQQMYTPDGRARKVLTAQPCSATLHKQCRVRSVARRALIVKLQVEKRDACAGARSNCRVTAGGTGPQTAADRAEVRSLRRVCDNATTAKHSPGS